MVFFLFTEPEAVLQHLGQGVAHPDLHVADTSHASADESEASQPSSSSCAIKAHVQNDESVAS